MLLRGRAPLRLYQVQVPGRGQEPSPALFVPVAAAGKVHQQEALRPAAAGSPCRSAQGQLQENSTSTTTTTQVRVVAFHYISPPSAATAKVQVVAFRHSSLPTSSSATT